MDGSNTTSTLRFTPTSRDHDVDIICSAFNPLMLGLENKNNQSSAGVEVKKRLIIHCKFHFVLLKLKQSLGNKKSKVLLNIFTRLMNLILKYEK